jgi:TonB dependent receptor/Carboxypeptidase regulatory-like domain
MVVTSAKSSVGTRWSSLTALVCCVLLLFGRAFGAEARLTGRVIDTLNRPLADAKVRLSDTSGHFVAQTISDSAGYFFFKVQGAGTYRVSAHKSGFELATVVVKVSGRRNQIVLTLASQTLSMSAVTAELNLARNALSPETGSTVYRFTARNIEELPRGENTPLNEVLVQAPGISQDSYGQGQDLIHVHGLNGGGLQYRLNGIFLPEAVSSFGQLFSPYFIQSLSLITNFMPAQFGYRNEGVIDIHTKDGCITPGGQLQYFGGQRATIKPSFEYGGCSGRFSYYLAGFYLQNNLGVASPTATPNPIHASTRQGQGFAYLSYLVAPTTRLSLIAGTAANYFQIPGQPDLPPMFTLAGVTSVPNSDDLDETEFEQNYYGILALQGLIGQRLNYQVAFFSRYFQLNYDPDPVGDLIYNGIASSIMHSGFINGLQADSSYRLNEHHDLQAGIYVSGETLEEDDHAQVFPLDSMGNPETTPIAITDNFNDRALLFGIYLQDQWHPTRKLEITAGARWDLMEYMGNQHQVSPRLGVVYHLTRTTALNAGYARYFQVPPFESVLLETINKFANTSGASDVPFGNQNIKAEDNNFFDVGLNQGLPWQMNADVTGFFYLAKNKQDLAQFGSTYIFAPLNYSDGRGWGTDFSLVKSSTNLSAYFNFSYEVVQGKNISAGQFLADDADELAYIAKHWITLDDDQMFVASSGVAYQVLGMTLIVDGFWGSGYRRGFANLGTLPPYLQVNAAIERPLDLPRIGKIIPRISMLNMFDHSYQIRNGTGVGVFAPSYGPRRTLYFSIRFPFGERAAKP